MFRTESRATHFYREPTKAPVKVSNIGLLANFIEGHIELPFDMDRTTSPTTCGTAGCIGAFSGALWPSDYHLDPELRLAQNTGLDSDVAFQVCWRPKTEEGNRLKYCQITRSMAVATLRRLDATGEVWFDTSE